MLVSQPLLVLALSGALAATACSKESVVPAVTVDRAEQFIGLPIPERATQVRAGGEKGRDELVLLSFEAEDRVARDYAARLLGAAPVSGRDPGLFYLGEGVSWWPQQLPPGAEGGEVRRDDNRTIKLLLAPALAPDQPTRVFVAAFTQ